MPSCGACLRIRSTAGIIGARKTVAPQCSCTQSSVLRAVLLAAARTAALGIGVAVSVHPHAGLIVLWQQIPEEEQDRDQEGQQQPDLA